MRKYGGKRLQLSHVTFLRFPLYFQLLRKHQGRVAGALDCHVSQKGCLRKGGVAGVRQWQSRKGDGYVLGVNSDVGIRLAFSSSSFWPAGRSTPRSEGPTVQRISTLCARGFSEADCLGVRSQSLCHAIHVQTSVVSTTVSWAARRAPDQVPRGFRPRPGDARPAAGPRD